MLPSTLKSIVCATALAAASVALAPGAKATPVLSFSKTNPATNAFTITAHSGTTTLSVADDSVVIGLIDGNSPAAPFDAFFNLSATSTNAASQTGGVFLQDYSGTYSITSGTGGTGTDYLSGSFVDLLSGLMGGHALTLSATTPPNTSLTMTSDIIPMADLGPERAMALALTNLPNAVKLTAMQTLASNSAIVSGDYSAGLNVIPEPASVAMFGAGLLSLTMLVRPRRKAR